MKMDKEVELSSVHDDDEMVSHEIEISQQRRKGSLITMPFIIANEALARMGSYKLHLGKATQIFLLSSALSNFRHVVGAFIAYSYLGPFLGVGLSSAVSFLIRDKGRSRMHIISVFFVCLLLTNTNSSYPLIFQSHHVPQFHKCDVFISFRGPGIRRGFLAHLVEVLSQKKITYFIDNKLIKGDEIAESLVQAIETSSISLVIFSENYASSSWCLDELVKIVECREKKGQVLLPVFYKVDPRVVRHQNGSYGIDFDEHEMKYSLSKVQQWRYALKKAADVSGFHSSNYLNDAELIKEIVKNVLKRLAQVRQFSSKQLVGIGKQISRVESLLKVDSQDVRVIGIWGINGIGKTTIAVEIDFHIS